MKIANINNLSLVSVAMERLVNRQDGLPGLGVLYGPSGLGLSSQDYQDIDDLMSDWLEGLIV